MVVVVPPPPTLSPEVISIFYVVDELLARSPVLVFYGPSATPTATSNNSRIQAHIFSPAGLQSYPRLTISPSSPLYEAVNCLPREEQGDEICRGLAFSLYKYFADLPQAVKDAWEGLPSAMGRLRAAPTLFSESHAALLASKMVKVENVAEVIQDVRQAFAEQTLSWLDVDVVLPPGTMKKLDDASRDSILPDPSDEDIAIHRYGGYAALVRLFGEAAFLPTSRLRRAPSKPTSLNRSPSFKREAKENVRREMCELLDTEESYVSKLYDLVHSVAEDFRQKALAKHPASSSPTAEALKGLFPPSLDQILQVNSDFLEALRKIVEDTENEAIQDIETTAEEGTLMPPVPTRTDVTGTLALATTLRTWFPKFANCYVDYVQAHSQFSNFLRIFMKETGSSFSKRLQETGEQRLMSMLIEPVQRLPRYQLYIDNITKQLPAQHPAIKPLLKARDTITDICSQDVTTAQPSRVIDHLCRIVQTWPATFKPAGRLVTAVDIVELAPPYRTDPPSPRSVAGILLLFTDFLVILRKLPRCSTNARGLLAQLDGVNVTEDKGDELAFRQALELPSVDVTEMDSGRMLQLVPKQTIGDHPVTRRPGSSRPGSLVGESLVQILHLTGAYEGKASRFVEELVKAKVEGRFPESEREGDKWEVRTASGADLTVFIAMFEEPASSPPDGRGVPARVRITVDAGKRSSGCSVLPAEMDIVASVSIVGEGFYRLEVDGACDYSAKDHLTAQEFLPVLIKRISNVLQMRSQIRNPALAATLLLRNQHILQSLKVVTNEPAETGVTRERSQSRPHSPVKLLTNLFGGAVNRDNQGFRKPAPVSSTPYLDMAQFPPPLAPTFGSRPSTKDGPGKTPVGLGPDRNATDELERLEATLGSYILALHARKGNIVGKTLRNRAAADELMVNELYNGLLENSANHEMTAQAPVDVLFAAFEKFVNVAWHEKMGPIISRETWEIIQAKLDSLYPGDFENVFRAFLGEMAPQNQRALRQIIKLLIDLLHGTSNDGDRGIMTASFAEVLAPEGNANEFVTVLDRLVEDVDAILLEPSSSAQATPYGSVSSRHHFDMSKASIVSATPSSLRKKFGLGLTRKTSKVQGDTETEVSSVWRTLSKSKHSEHAKSSSFSKATAPINRSNSDAQDMRPSPKRPVSRDRAPVLGAFSYENNGPLSTIGENAVTGPPRKKRRSSVSDMRSLHASASNTPLFEPLATPTKMDFAAHQDSPRTPSPVKPSQIPAPSPPKTTPNSAMRAVSPSRREGSPLRALPRPLQITKTQNAPPRHDEVTITSHAPVRRRKDSSASGIPTLKPVSGLSERPTSGNIRKLPPTPGSPDKAVSEKPSHLPPPAAKLRMQSPQKLRERLANEQKALQSADAALQEELSKIGEELKNLSSRAPSTSTHLRTPAAGLSNVHANTHTAELRIAAVEKQLAVLTTKHASTISTLTSHLDSLASDIASSLQVSETRAKNLDALHREANAENEALYARFNDELARVLGRVRGGSVIGTAAGDEELRKRVKDAEDEAAKLRRENGRLKREVLGLRAQLRE